MAASDLIWCLCRFSRERGYRPCVFHRSREAEIAERCAAICDEMGKTFLASPYDRDTEAATAFACGAAIRLTLERQPLQKEE